MPFQSLQFLRAENLRDQAHVAMQLKGRAGPVAGDDAGAFLPAMLQREESVVGQDGRVRMTEDGKNAALVLRKHGGIPELSVAGVDGGIVSEQSTNRTRESIARHALQTRNRFANRLRPRGESR